MIPAKVKAMLDQNGLEAIEFEAGSTPTAPMAAERLGVTVGQIAKSLLFLGKNGKFYMVVCAGDCKVSNSRLKHEIGVKSRMARAEETLAATGFEPGGVCPFAVDGFEILIDESLCRYDVVYPAAGTNASGVPIGFDELVRVTAGRICSVAEPMG